MEPPGLWCVAVPTCEFVARNASWLTFAERSRRGLKSEMWIVVRTPVDSFYSIANAPLMGDGAPRNPVCSVHFSSRLVLAVCVSSHQYVLITRNLQCCHHQRFSGTMAKRASIDSLVMCSSPSALTFMFSAVNHPKTRARRESL